MAFGKKMICTTTGERECSKGIQPKACKDVEAKLPAAGWMNKTMHSNEQKKDKQEKIKWS